MNIILFGQAGAGKTTIANILLDSGKGYVKGSLGKKIHDECAFHGKESREEMQKYGQAMREIFGIDVWNQYLYNILNNHVYRSLDNERVVIDDGRQLNEFDFWTEKRFLTVGVKADFEIRKLRIWEREGKILTEEQAQHETELQAAKCIEKCKIIIENNGTWEELRSRIENNLGGQSI